MLSVADKFRMRGDAFIDGIHLLIDYGVRRGGFEATQKDFLHDDLDRIRDEYHDDIAVIDDFSLGLFHLNALLKRFIVSFQAELSLSKDEAFQVICEAEQFAVWSKGRKDLVSKVHLNRFWVNQRDQPVCQLAREQKREFLRVTRNDFPKWYGKLSEWQKNYLRSILIDITEENIDDVILTIPSNLRSIPGLANYSFHTFELRDDNNQLIFDSHRFCAAIPSPTKIKDKHERRRLAKQNVVQLIERQLNNVGERYLEKWQPVITPGQVLALPVLLQSLLSPIWVDIFSPIFYPGRNETKFINDKEYVISRLREKLASGRGIIELRKGETVYRLDPVLISTNYPVNFLRRETLLIKSRTSANSQNGTVLLQCVSNFIRDVILPKFSDKNGYHVELFKSLIYDELGVLVQRESLFFAISLTLPVLKTRLKKFRKNINLCLNALNLKNLIRNQPDEASRLKKALTLGQIRDLKLLLNALRDYITLYNTMRKWTHHKEMFLSSLEEMITEKIGGLSCSTSLASCNRKSMQILHTDAMLLYQQQYGVLPVYNDIPANRRRFVDKFADLFFTDHQQQRAAQNAPGAVGIREIVVLPFAKGMYMVPKDIVAEIKRRHKHAISDNAQFARLSRVADPFSFKSVVLQHMKNWISDLYHVVKPA
jgi:hypothetical protein